MFKRSESRDIVSYSRIFFARGNITFLIVRNRIFFAAPLKIFKYELYASVIVDFVIEKRYNYEWQKRISVNII